jgi:hypothetical protein
MSYELASRAFLVGRAVFLCVHGRLEALAWVAVVSFVGQARRSAVKLTALDE